MADFSKALVNPVFKADGVAPPLFQLMYEELQSVKDFPIEGVSFIDINPMMNQRIYLGFCIHMMAHLVPDDTEVILGVESRGFIFGAAIAAHLNLPFVPVRKKGKLPPPFITVSTKSEYADVEFEVPVQSELKLGCFIDDVAATGGTIGALEAGLSEHFLGLTAVFLLELAYLNPAKELHSLDYDAVIKVLEP
jgi:adenine phosphoribosyltransferase